MDKPGKQQNGSIVGEDPSGEIRLDGSDDKFPKSVFFIIGNEFCERYHCGYATAFMYM